MSIEGIPEGWELVRVGKPLAGEFFIDGLSCPHQAMDDRHFHGCAIIRKIEKPKQYRAFANAAEYAPHRGRWWKKTSGDDRTYPPCYYNDSYHGGLHFDRCFIDRTFDDGTPFGVEVTS